MSLSNVRSIPLSEKKIIIGEYVIDIEAEEKAEKIILDEYPNLIIVKNTEGKRQIPLQNIVQLNENIHKKIRDTYSQGHEEGKKEGYEIGLHKGREDARQAVASFSGILNDITNQRYHILADTKNKVLELILKIARRMTFMAAEINPEITMSIITGTIDQLLDKRKIKVKVHPDHLAELEQHIDRFMGDNTAIKEFVIEPDPRIRAGGCFIETPSGDIDARLESMYNVIKQALLESEEEAG